MSISILDYCDFCFSKPADYIGCELFWLSCIIVAEFFLLWFFISTLKNILRERKQWRDYYQRLADREKIADPEVMEKHIWRGE